MKTLNQIRENKYLKYSDLMKAYADSFKKDGGLGPASKKIKKELEKEKKKLGVKEDNKNVYTVSVLFRDEKKAKAFSKDKNLLKLAKVTGIEKTQLRFKKIGWTVDLESEKNNIAQNPINKKIETIKSKYE